MRLLRQLLERLRRDEAGMALVLALGMMTVLGISVVTVAQSTVIVGGNLDVSNNAAVGASTNMSTRVETYVGGNCRYATGSWVACSGDQDAKHIYSKLSDGVTIAVNHN